MEAAGSEEVGFVKSNSIVKQIWGSADHIMVIFGGAAAEFALNKAVDWLYYTGRLPADPIGRLFSTVKYARVIVFASKTQAYKSIDAMAAIHAGVEASRGYRIPDWAYRDVLFMLIDYSIRAYELLERKLTIEEKEEVYLVFGEVGRRMGLKELPHNYTGFTIMREEHLQNNLAHSKYTTDLFKQYRKHLGWLRYQLLLQTQLLVVPKRVKEMLQMPATTWFTPLVSLYKLSRKAGVEKRVQNIVLPAYYKAQIRDLDMVESPGAKTG